MGWIIATVALYLLGAVMTQTTLLAIRHIPGYPNCRTTEVWIIVFWPVFTALLAMGLPGAILRKKLEGRT